MVSPADRRYAPATQRNRVPILEILQSVLPPTGTVLEVGSGTGEHAVCFAPQLAPRYWLPSDPHPISLASIAAWRDAEPCDTLRPPIALDAATAPWPVEETPPVPPLTAIVSINMIHIAPWAACDGLLAGAGRILPPGGILYLYGPFFQADQPTAPSNVAFDRSLRSQDPAWGIRDLETVVQVAQTHQLAGLKTVPMPANNLSVIFQRMTVD